MSDTPCVGAGIWELCEAQEFDVYVTYMVSCLVELQLNFNLVLIY